ncbi:hypothetical protein ABE021_09570 [Sporosarcina gallistercoris]|uniref:hypothetical protein n=1 Tax=Sporosarcina gallistercoris TaxID=2762245 RepID=UPI003D289B2C
MEAIVDHAEGILHHLEKLLRHIGEFLDNGTQFTWRKELISGASLVCVGYLVGSGRIGMNGPFKIIGGGMSDTRDRLSITQRGFTIRWRSFSDT